MKIVVIVFIVISVLLAFGMLIIAVKDLIEDLKMHKQMKSSQGEFSRRSGRFNNHLSQ